MPYQQNAILQKIIAQRLVNLASANVNFAGMKILDVGCGTGFIAQSLVQTGVKSSNILQIDKNTASLDVAKQFGNTEVADFNNPLFFNTQFDVIFSSMALQWSCDFSKTLNYLKNIISQRGSMFFTIPLKNSLNELYNTMQIEPFAFPSLENVEAKLIEVKQYSENAYIALKNIHGAELTIGNTGNVDKKRLLLLKKLQTQWEVGFFKICKA